MGRHAWVPDAVTGVMRAGRRHTWTLPELEQALCSRGTPADYSTVFRAVGQLQAAGTVRRVELGDGRAHFELETGHHDHLHCRVCDRLWPLPCQLAQGALAGAAQDLGFAIEDHRLLITGTCEHCRQAGEADPRQAGDADPWPTGEANPQPADITGAGALHPR